MKPTLRQATLVIAALLLVLAVFDMPAAPRPTSIQGRTLIYTGPIFDGPPPPVLPAVVTTFPVSTTFTVLMSRTGRVVAHVTSDANGDFAVSLRPGRYIILPADLPDSLTCSYTTPQPFKVTVRPRRVSGAGLTYIGDCHSIIGTPTP